MENEQKWQNLLCDNCYLLCSGVPCVLKFPESYILVHNTRYISEAFEKTRDEFFSYFSPMPLRSEYIKSLDVPGSVSQWDGRVFTFEKREGNGLRYEYELFVAKEDWSGDDWLYSLTISVCRQSTEPTILLEDEIIRYVHELQYYLGSYLTITGKDSGTWFSKFIPNIKLEAIFGNDFSGMPILKQLENEGK